MPAPTIVRRTLSSSDASAATPPSDAAMKDSLAMSFLNFDEPHFEHHPTYLTSPEEPMLFEFDNAEFHPSSPVYDFHMADEFEAKPQQPLFGGPASPIYDLAPAYSPDSFHGSDVLYPEDFGSSPSYPINNNNWFNTRDAVETSPIPSPSSPIPIPSSGPQSPSFFSFSDHHPFGQQQQQQLPADNAFSPTALAAALPLPSSSLSQSPASSFEEHHHHFPPPPLSVSPHETQSHTPAWATQLWDSPPRPGHLRTPSSPRSIALAASAARHSPLGIPAARERRNSLTSGYLFPSSSAPSVPALAMASSSSGQNTIRAYSRRAESFGSAVEAGTVRRTAKKQTRGSVAAAGNEDEFVSAGMETGSGAGKAQQPHDIPPLKSVLRPPKLAPSAWQLYFTDWIQRQQQSSSRKLNVAQAAKEAGQEYASLSEEEKEPYKRRSQAAKDVREKQLQDYMRTLTPDDIKRENAFRSAQRKAGKSRKSNIKDPNAPKKPLSAYFMFLQRIRASPELVREVFGEETETTKQSVLAAAKWRSMTDDERKPFLAQAEQEKMEYEAARRLYEDGAAGSVYAASNFNFSILPGSPAFPAIKIESESESEGFATDNDAGGSGARQRQQSLFVNQHAPLR
ncbi:hypothetical protein R3P38DRAFT_3303076 [Favolaschia claudopus]|uniref:HMG box domain-containing protein n=1 Tax=Favolaschia claudopus TaxID=2862362 RepID=A0AAW0EEZ0_9AGAR